MTIDTSPGRSVPGEKGNITEQFSSAFKHAENKVSSLEQEDIHELALRSSSSTITSLESRLVSGQGNKEAVQRMLNVQRAFHLLLEEGHPALDQEQVKKWAHAQAVKEQITK